jgi:hypothetical protein
LISAINRSGPPQLGHARTSMPKVRRIKSAQRHQRLDVDVQIQGASKPLNDCDRAAATLDHPAASYAAPEKAEDCPHEAAHDRPTQLVVPRQQIPKLGRQAQYSSPGPITLRARTRDLR